MSKFTPYIGKVEIKPLEKDKVILSEEKQYIECGEVIEKGEATDFVNIGDIIFFDAWKMGIAIEQNGTKHYVVSLDGQGTLGKIEYE